MYSITWIPTADDIVWDLIRAALASVADTAIIPLQDILGLGSSARMNTSGLSVGKLDLALQVRRISTTGIIGRLRHLTELYGRKQTM